MEHRFGHRDTEHTEGKMTNDEWDGGSRHWGLGVRQGNCCGDRLSPPRWAGFEPGNF